MKRFCLSLLVALLCSYSYAQNTYPWPSSGSVGIGTSSPGSLLHLSATGGDVFHLQYNNGGNGGNWSINPYILGVSNGGLSFIDDQHSTTPFVIGDGGNVGIGATAPNGKLTIFDPTVGNSLFVLSRASNASVKALDMSLDSSDNTIITTANADLNFKTNFNAGSPLSTMYLNYLGNVGIGTTSPSENLSVAGASSSGSISLVPGTSTYAGYKLVLTTQAANEGFNMTMGGTKIMSAYGYYDADEIGFGNLGHENLLYLSSNGNVGIGTTSPDAKLAVNGTVHTKEVKVDLTGWSDYVFKPEYKLAPLSEIKSYIDKHQHLPEVPSEQAVIKNGVNLGEMNKLLVKKVEELTLYLIEKDKQINDQTRQIQNQEERLNVLEKAIGKLSQ